MNILIIAYTTIVCLISVATLIAGFVSIFLNSKRFKNRNKILDAIHLYNINSIDDKTGPIDFVDYCCIWTHDVKWCQYKCEDLVSADVYEKIKPFIGKPIKF